MAKKKLTVRKKEAENRRIQYIKKQAAKYDLSQKKRNAEQIRLTRWNKLKHYNDPNNDRKAQYVQRSLKDTGEYASRRKQHWLKGYDRIYDNQLRREGKNGLRKATSEEQKNKYKILKAQFGANKKRIRKKDKRVTFIAPKKNYTSVYTNYEPEKAARFEMVITFRMTDTKSKQARSVQGYSDFTNKYQLRRNFNKYFLQCYYNAVQKVYRYFYPDYVEVETIEYKSVYSSDYILRKRNAKESSY